MKTEYKIIDIIDKNNKDIKKIINKKIADIIYHEENNND